MIVATYRMFWSMFVLVTPAAIGVEVVGGVFGILVTVFDDVGLAPPHAVAIRAVAVSVSSRVGPISRFLSVIASHINGLNS